MTDASAPIRIAMLIYPGFTTLDLVGPQQVLSALPDTTVHLVAKTADPVTTDSGITIAPDRSFADCEPQYDLLFIPGGRGTEIMVRDDATLAFVRTIATNARYLTSVCTGSLILAAAGLLDGYRAASHWAFREFLAAYGAIPDDRRVVVDRDRMTGGGVTAGIDFALQLAAVLTDEKFARTLQLVLEYDPAPPFDCGTPERADKATLDAAIARLEAGVGAMRRVAGERVAMH
ncbi:DJ-1/PfpI family protein [Mycolicibacterium mageritense]|uniref:DJ-1/PfpI family protein n=1 Tax=Mycolicibacterium mageritense TaxID=53462 RepID=UPI0011D53C7B|nr:DJ-1/PfpI family protein [Mycolicibacterium mageritense]TXI61369.1 MAG: DJ-1/PfpI family protein [Mycolicibacterium mageritense]